MKNLILSIIILTGACNALTLKAQALSGEQTVTVTLPSKVEIDGLASEWDNKFQAHDKSANVNYTVANNAQSLYLVVQATDPLIIKKIIGGGITFTINTSGQKDNAAPFSVTFPLIANNFQLPIFSTINEIASEENRKLKDSLINIANKKIVSLTTTVNVKGFKAIADTLLSAHNTTGITSAVLINSNGALTCEFLVPVRLLGIAENSEKLIAYNVMLNGVTTIQSVNRGNGMVVTSVPRSLSQNTLDTQAAQHPTDFWGKYLIK